MCDHRAAGTAFGDGFGGTSAQENAGIAGTGPLEVASPRVEGLVQALRTVLCSRGLRPSEDDIRRIDACRDERIANLWVAQAVTAGKMRQVFEGDPDYGVMSAPVLKLRRSLPRGVEELDDAGERAFGAAGALQTMLSGTDLAPTEADRDRINRCTDRKTIAAWVWRAARAKTMRDVFGEEHEEH